MVKVPINCDVGEQDNAPESVDLVRVAPYLSAINIACGFHAGSPRTIAEAIRIAAEYGIDIGAHPSYNDRENFGRKVIEVPEDEMYEEVVYQVGAVRAMALAAGASLNHVKPHGALYNETARNKSLCRVVYHAIKAVSPKLKVYGLPGTLHESVAHEIGLKFVAEGFGDRRYETSIQLMSRQKPGSVLSSEAEVIRQVEQMMLHRQVETASDGLQPIQVDTICVHGDSHGAEKMIESIYKHFNQ